MLERFLKITLIVFYHVAYRDVKVFSNDLQLIWIGFEVILNRFLNALDVILA